MSIYTRTGDKGTTSLFGGKRVSKSDPQVEAYGSVDELTSFLGLIISKLPPTNHELITTQKDLYKIMAYLSGAKTDLKFLKKRVKDFEKQIDRLDKKLPKLTRFILPGGNQLSAWFHILRVTCRRSERSVVKYFTSLSQPYTLYPNPLVIKYLNRLSDLFFNLARFYNKGKDFLT